MSGTELAMLCPRKRTKQIDKTFVQPRNKKPSAGKETIAPQKQPSLASDPAYHSEKKTHTARSGTELAMPQKMANPDILRSMAHQDPLVSSSLVPRSIRVCWLHFWGVFGAPRAGWYLKLPLNNGIFSHTGIFCGLGRDATSRAGMVYGI